MARKGFYFLVLAFFLGCGSDGSSDFVAKVNGRKIATREWEETLAKVAQATNQNYAQPDARAKLLGDMINKELLFQKAVKEKLHLNSTYLKDQIVQEYLRTTIGADATPATDAEVDAMLNEKKPEVERVRASHILIKDEAMAQKALAEIRADRKPDFAKYALRYSQDPGSRQNGGDLGFFRRRDMVPPFSAAAFGLKKVGDVSDLVRTQFGYHIIQLTGDQRDSESLRPQVAQEIVRSRQRGRVEALLAKLRDGASISIDEKAVNASSPGAK